MLPPAAFGLLFYLTSSSPSPPESLVIVSAIRLNCGCSTKKSKQKTSAQAVLDDAVFPQHGADGSLP